MRWRCFAGSGSPGPSRSRGARRRGPRPGTSAADSSSPASPGGRLRPGRCQGSDPRGEVHAVDAGALRDGLPQFYEYHLEAGTGPISNPFPLARAGRVHAHHNPMDSFPKQTAGLFRPRVPKRVPNRPLTRCSNELFARLRSTGTECRLTPVAAKTLSGHRQVCIVLGIVEDCLARLRDGRHGTIPPCRPDLHDVLHE